jgi:capsular polysaccharide transport system ATP-binding protein
MGMLRRLCDCAMVLEAGRLTWFEDLEEAIAVHEARLLG